MTRPGVAPLFTDSPNARSKTITIATGPSTNGALNQHPQAPAGYTIGVAEDTGARRTMEDAHSFVADFAGVRGQAYFAVFDGHAGKHAAEWCGQHFHETLLDQLASASSDEVTKIPDVLNKTFHAVDDELSRIADDGQTHSGCTAVTAFLRLEDANSSQPAHFVHSAHEFQQHSSRASTISVTPGGSSGTTIEKDGKDNRHLSGKVKSVVRNLRGKSPSGSGNHSPVTAEPETIDGTAASELPTPNHSSITHPANTTTISNAATAQFSAATRRVLYTANAGDARAVISRSGRALRLTYDHKGSDVHEAARIKTAGGFVMNNRVNGVLAVTRALGDSAMKEFVVGAPYTTETELGEEDDVLIIACDGLWDVLEDQAAIDLVRSIATAPGTSERSGPQEAAERLVKYALEHFSSDNISVVVVHLHDGWRAGSAEGRP